MNIDELVSKLNNYKNPYVALFSSINHAVDDSIINLIDFISKNSNEDINYRFFSEGENTYNENFNLIESTILDKLGELRFKSGFGWNTSFPNRLLDKLYELGLDFNSESKKISIDKVKIESALNSSDLSLNECINGISANSNIFNIQQQEIRNISFIKRAYSQTTQENFNELVKKYGTLHNATATGQKVLVDFLIKDCNINPNLENEAGFTPIFLAKSREMLEVLSKYDIDWFKLTKENKNCINIYTNLSDKETSKKMIDFSEKKMKESINSGNNNAISEEELYERVKNNLLDMVKSDKTKKELSDFIKKYKIKDISKIKDEKGNSLALLCLAKNNWARYDIFKSAYGLEYENNSGVSTLEVMFLKSYVTREDHAFKIINEILETNSFEKNKRFARNLIQRSISKDNYLSLPNWYFSRRNGDTELNFYKTIVKENQIMIEDFKQEVNKAKNNQEYRYYSASIDTSRYATHLMLSFAKLYGEGDLLEQINISGLFKEEMSYKGKENFLKLKDKGFANIVNIIELCSQYKYFDNFDIHKFKTKFEKTLVENISIGISQIHNNSNLAIDFFSSSKDALNYLIKQKSMEFANIIDEDFMQKFNDFHNYATKEEDKQIYSGLQYLMLSRNISENQSLTKKATKIKI